MKVYVGDLNIHSRICSIGCAPYPRGCVPDPWGSPNLRIRGDARPAPLDLWRSFWTQQKDTDVHLSPPLGSGWALEVRKCHYWLYYKTWPFWTFGRCLVQIQMFLEMGEGKGENRDSSGNISSTISAGGKKMHRSRSVSRSFGIQGPKFFCTSLPPTTIISVIVITWTK